MKWIFFRINLIILTFFILDRILKKLFLLREVFYYKFGPFSFYFNKTLKLFFGVSVTNVWLNILTFFILFFLISQLKEAYSKKEITPLIVYSLILAGGASNILDRIVYGFIVDYINLGDLSIFNLADLMIWTGFGVLLIDFVMNLKGKKTNIR